MTIIASPPFRQGNASAQRDFPGSSTNHNVQFASQPPLQLVDGVLKSQTLKNPLNDRNGAFGKQIFTNGHAAGGIANGRANVNLSPEQQELIRSRTDSQKLVHRPRAPITRTQTDFGPNHQIRSSRLGVAEEVGELRHGWEDQYNSSEFLGLLSSVRLQKPLKNCR